MCEKDKMESRRYIILIPFFNCKNYIGECLDSVLDQTYRNWLAVCADDHSDDHSSASISQDEGITKIYNPDRVTALPNLYNAIMNSGITYDDDDVLCILDGDDKFLHPYALSIVNEIYAAYPNCLLTYGQYITSLGRLGHCKEYTEEEFSKLRKQDFRASHLKTFKWKLYREFLNQDPSLSAYKNSSGNFYTMSSDAAIMIPLMEIAGYNNIRFNKHPVYWYRLHERNDHVIDREKQLEIQHEINAKGGVKTVFQATESHSFRKRVYFGMRRLFRKLVKSLFCE